MYPRASVAWRLSSGWRSGYSLSRSWAAAIAADGVSSGNTCEARVTLGRGLWHMVFCALAIAQAEAAHLFQCAEPVQGCTDGGYDGGFELGAALAAASSRCMRCGCGRRKHRLQHCAAVIHVVVCDIN